jgi:hypothetical protein
MTPYSDPDAKKDVSIVRIRRTGNLADKFRVSGMNAEEILTGSLANMCSYLIETGGKPVKSAV